MWKRDSLNLARKCGNLLRKVADCKRFAIAVATNDVPRLSQLVKQSFKNGASIGATTNQIEKAMTGAYHARGYGQNDLDIALMVLRLGGRKLLYALNQHISIPSIRALRKASIATRLTPSIGQITFADVSANIRAIFLPEVKLLNQDRPFRSGMAIFWDEISLEETACYFPRTDSVGGLCREHSGNVDVQLKTFDHAVSIARSLDDGSVHYGKEASVIAVGSYGTTIRGGFPVAVSPTCKHETPTESALVLETVINAWNHTAKAFFGPIWSFASDGDAGRRQMIHNMFKKYAITPVHRLYKYVGRLPGLNLLVGDDDITPDIDWKHEVKRAYPVPHTLVLDAKMFLEGMARVLRTEDGMVINRTIINYDVLHHHLSRDESLSPAAVDELLKPDDTQDVPRSIDLFRAVERIAKIPSLDPTELQELQALALIGDMYCAFLDAYIQLQPSWSLTRQVTSLSKFAHMAFALFSTSRINFMPHQLYGDLQLTIKNVIFSIAKQQDMDDTQPFYLFWTGDDRLENLFGRTRMQGGHSPNFSFKQLLDRLVSAMDLDAIFFRNPKLDSGHRRLKVTRTEKADHLNPESWTGNALPKELNLESAWLGGRDGAIESLKAMDKRMVPDFTALFDASRNLDMMKPFGDGNLKYPGVSTEADRSIEPEPIGNARGPLKSLNGPRATTSPNGSSSRHSEEALSEATVAPLAVDSESNLAECSVAPAADASGADGADLYEEAEADLEDILEDDDEDDYEGDSNMEQTTTSSDTQAGLGPWVDHNGKKIHKASLCRLVITPDYIRKSHERKFRVRGFTTEKGRRTNPNTNDVIDPNDFLVGDLFASLVICEGAVAVAILKSVVIEEKGARVNRVELSKMKHSACNIKISGQVLDMQPVKLQSTGTEIVQSMDNGLQPPLPASLQAPGWKEDDRFTWLWNGSFVKLDLDQTTSAPVGKNARKMVCVSISSLNCTPVNPEVKSVAGLLKLEECPELNATGLTWEIDEEAMSSLPSILWDGIRESGGLSLVPKFKSSHGRSLPYRTPWLQAMVSTDACAELEKQTAPSTDKLFKCYQCGLSMDSSKARFHVGHHILKSMRNVAETFPGRAIEAMPCGFCGRSNISSCSQVFLTSKTSPQAMSNCLHYRRFQYQPSTKVTSSSYCTNVPIFCRIPGCTGTSSKMFTAVWKYNMPDHIRTHHKDYSSDGIEVGAPLPQEMVSDMIITRQEELKIGIPEDRIPPQSTTQPSIQAPASRGTKRTATNDHPRSTLLPNDISTPPSSKRARKK